SSQSGNRDPGPSIGSNPPKCSTILRRTAIPAPRPRTSRASCVVVSILSQLRTYPGTKPAVGSCSPASTQQKLTATLGYAAKIDSNVCNQCGGTTQSSSVMTISLPLVWLNPTFSAHPLPAVRLL